MGRHDRDLCIAIIKPSFFVKLREGINIEYELYLYTYAADGGGQRAWNLHQGGFGYFRVENSFYLERDISFVQIILPDNE